MYKDQRCLLNMNVSRHSTPLNFHLVLDATSMNEGHDVKCWFIKCDKYLHLCRVQTDPVTLETLDINEAVVEF